MVTDNDSIGMGKNAITRPRESILATGREERADHPVSTIFRSSSFGGKAGYSYG